MLVLDLMDKSIIYSCTVYSVLFPELCEKEILKENLYSVLFPYENHSDGIRTQDIWSRIVAEPAAKYIRTASSHLRSSMVYKKKYM